jgi:hypothetical protein
MGRTVMALPRVFYKLDSGCRLGAFSGSASKMKWQLASSPTRTQRTVIVVNMPLA